MYVGAARMTFHWVQEGKTEVWRCNTAMLDPAAAQVVEKIGGDGSQKLEVEIVNVYSAASSPQRYYGEVQLLRC